MSEAPEQDALEAVGRVARDGRAELVKRARREGLSAEDAIDCVHDALCTFLELALRGELPEMAPERQALLAGIVVNTARNKRRRHYLAKRHAPLDAEAH